MIDHYIQKWFRVQGRFCARRPLVVFLIALAVIIPCLVGLTKLRIEQKPQNLWVQPNSRTAKDMHFFDNAFRPFYRVEEVIITSRNPMTNGNVLNNDAMLELMEFINIIAHKEDPDTHVSLQDMCWHPIEGKGCLMNSVLAYLQNNITNVKNAIADGGVNAQILRCVKTPLDLSCYSDLNLPVERETVLGKDYIDYADDQMFAEAALTTFLLENSNDQHYIDTARSWEKNVFIEECDKWNKRSQHVNVYYMAQRSVQDALDSQNKASIMNVGISYAVMFTYIAIALGYWSKIHSKGSVALAGILIVGISIMVSVGFCSAIDIPLTLIITDVIPFLLVAIGVDNMFIISNQFWLRLRVHQRKVHAPLSREIIEKAMGEALGEVGGTIVMAGASEGIAFTIGSLTTMPAVRAFCLYSGVAIFCNLALQVTVFVAFLSLDARRASDRRWDLLPCYQEDSVDSDDAFETRSAQGGYSEIDPDAADDPDSPVVTRDSTAMNLTFRLANGKEEEIEMTPSEYVKHREEARDGGLLGLGRGIRFVIRKYYVPLVLNKPFQIAVVIIFIGFSIFMLAWAAPKATLGLKQTDPVPDHSYLRAFFLAMEEYLSVGPLIYFASPSNDHEPLLNFSDPKVLEPYLEMTTILREYTPYIASATIASWFDDLRHWVCYNSFKSTSIQNGDGCIDFTKLNISVNSEADVDAMFNCSQSLQAQKMPFKEFTAIVKQFLATPRCCHMSINNKPVGANTGLCGFQYGQEVILGNVTVDANGDIRPYDPPAPTPKKSSSDRMAHVLETYLSEPGAEDQQQQLATQPKAENEVEYFEYVRYSRVRAQTVRLSSNKDFISSMGSAYNFSNSITATPQFKEAGISVFPYSIYFIYYSQYKDLSSEAALEVGMALIAVILVTFVVMSSLSCTVSVALSLVMILIDLVGVMAVWEIDVNAISVVNLVMCVGISVEFCAHIAVAFCSTRGHVEARMTKTLVDMGSNVFMGITLTKLLGVSILNFSPSRVFRVYYFRMYATIIIFGALHGLVFLPCLLMLIGAPFRGRDDIKKNVVIS